MISVNKARASSGCETVVEGMNRKERQIDLHRIENRKANRKESLRGGGILPNPPLRLFSNQ